MTSPYENNELTARELGEFGFVRVRDLAFDAVHSLWTTRRAEGMTQKDIAERIGVDHTQISRALQGPANWTMKTFGLLVQGLKGVARIEVIPLENVLDQTRNSDVFSEYESPEIEDGWLELETIEPSDLVGASI